MEAEKEIADVSSTPEVEETPDNQVVAELGETNDQEFDDSGQDEEQVEETSTPNTDTEETTEISFADKFKKKQSKEENAEWARKRRAEEQAKNQTEEAERKGYIKGLIESVGGKNPYTNEAIETEEDVNEYLLMKKIDEAGDDPLADYHRYLKAERKQKAEVKAKEFDYKADRKLFEEKYPNVDLETLINDEEFRDFSNDLIGKAPLATIFDKYVKLQERINKKVKEQVKVEMSKKISSAGSLRQTQDSNVRQSYSDMGKDDFNKLLEKARNGELRKS